MTCETQIGDIPTPTNYNGNTLTEHEKLAAVDNEVPTTLPLSSIPSKNELIINALTPIIHRRQSPRVMSDTYGHTHVKSHNKSSPALF